MTYHAGIPLAFPPLIQSLEQIRLYDPSAGCGSISTSRSMRGEILRERSRS